MKEKCANILFKWFKIPGGRYAMFKEDVKEAEEEIMQFKNPKAREELEYIEDQKWHKSIIKEAEKCIKGGGDSMVSKFNFLILLKC